MRRKCTKYNVGIVSNFLLQKNLKLHQTGQETFGNEEGAEPCQMQADCMVAAVPERKPPVYGMRTRMLALAQIRGIVKRGIPAVIIIH